MSHIRPRVITALDAHRSRAHARSPLAMNAAGTPPPATEDGYLTKLIKYIPAEAIATHQALVGFDKAENASLIGWLAVALLPASIYWYYMSTKEKGEEPAISQVVLTPLAFAMWMLVVQSPAVIALFHKQLLTPEQGSIWLIFVTATIPIVEKGIEFLVKRPSTPPPGT